MGYIKDRHGHQSPDFIKGFLAAIDAYAVYRSDGKQYIGSPEQEKRVAMKKAVIELGGNLEDYFNQEK